MHYRHGRPLGGGGGLRPSELCRLILPDVRTCWPFEEGIRVFLKGGGSKGCGGMGLWGGPPNPAGDPELIGAPKKFFGLN